MDAGNVTDDALLVRTEGTNHHRIVEVRRKDKRVEGITLRSEADFISTIRLEGLFIEITGLLLDLTFTIDLPRTGGIDTLSIHLEPIAHRAKEGNFIIVDGTIATHGDIEHEISILTDNIDKHFDHHLRCFVLMAFKESAAIVPISNAGIGLPRERENLITLSTLHVEDDGVALLVIEIFGSEHGFIGAVIPLDAGVVVIGSNIESNLGIDLVERQDRIIEVNHVGLVGGDEIHHAVVKFLTIGGIGHRATMLHIPSPKWLARLPRQFGLVILAVEILGIESLPPFALPIGLSQLAIIGNPCLRTFLISPLASLHPVVGVGAMHGDGEFQTSCARGFFPITNNVALWPDSYGIPRLIFGIPAIEVVMMVGECHEILRASPLVESHHFFRIPVLCMPERIDVLESELTRMPIAGGMEEIIGTPFVIHILSIPVAHFRYALRRPVGPDAELRIAEPCWALILTC